MRKLVELCGIIRTFAKYCGKTVDEVCEGDIATAIMPSSSAVAPQKISNSKEAFFELCVNHRVLHDNTASTWVGFDNGKVAVIKDGELTAHVAALREFFVCEYFILGDQNLDLFLLHDTIQCCIAAHETDHPALRGAWDGKPI